MEELKYKIDYDESISRWWVTDMKQAAFESPYETFNAEVNLGEAYVQIIYPVRKEFLKQNKLQNVKYYDGTYNSIYFPFENNRVDFTTFIHTPHHIWVNAKTYLDVEEAGEYPFEIYTCGGMKIWVNKKEVLCYAPYTRNIPGKISISIQLQAGMNEVVVYADELAERDVFFYYEMRYKGDKSLTGVLPVDQSVNEIMQTEKFLKSCYFEKDCVYEGELILKYDGSLLDVDKHLIVQGDEESAKNNNVDIDEVNNVIASRNNDEVSLGDIKRHNVGILKILIGIKVGSFIISRGLVVGIIPKDIIDFQPMLTIEDRKKQALEFICIYGENVVNRTMAILEVQNEMTDKAYACLQISLEKIKNKEDCSDFVLVPMFLMITRYRSYLTDEVYEDIKNTIIDFRYWIDEPGNDVMWYFSENHAFLFNISQYLSGYLFPEDVFSVSKRLGKEQYLIGKKRVEEWFDTFFKYGYAEWNSATYIPIDLIGFFVLFEMAPDESIRKLAKKALDFTFKVVTYNTYNGIMSSSYGRAYEDTLKARQLVEPSFTEWVSYGSGRINFRSRSVSLYCLSSYVPPDYDKEVALKENEWMSVEFDQGLNKVKTYNFKTVDYFIACVKRFKPFEHGHQQHLMNVALGKNSIQYYVNHPGERPFSGGNRPCYWAGNGTIPFIEQYKNVMVMLFKIDPNELVHYIHSYSTFYDFDEYEITGKWLFVKVDNSYMGTYFSNGISYTNYGANKGKEVISYGLNHGVIVKCGSSEEFESFNNFKNILKSMKITYNGEEFIKFNDPQYGEVIIDGIDNVTVKGESINHVDQSTMKVLKGQL